MTGNKYTPYQVVWETTLRCNLKCIHCGSAAGKARSVELSTEQAKKFIRDLTKIDTKEVCFMGGEPLLRKNWYELGREVKDQGMEFLIITNGYLADEKVIEKLKKLDAYAVAYSLDGATAETHDYIRGVKGSFERVMNAIELTKKIDLPTTVLTTISKINYKELPSIKDYLLNKKIAWQIQMGTPAGRFGEKYALSKEEYYTVSAYIASLKKTYTKEELPVIGAHSFGYNSKFIPSLGLYSEWIGCQAGITILSIKSNGDVIGCLATPKSCIEGNILEKSIVDIWNDPKSFTYNRKFSIKDLGENCAECKYGESCKGGCLGMSTTFTGKLHNDPYCLYKIEKDLDL